MRKVTAYRCIYCGKLYLRERNCVNHEKRCNENPQVRPLCYGCKHYEQATETEEITFYYDSAYGEQARIKNFQPHRCGISQVKLYNAVKLSEDYQETLEYDNGYAPMPRLSGGCRHYTPYI